MGHLLFGAPDLPHFHLHERLARALAARDHRVTVLAGGPRAFRAYSEHGLAVRALARGRPCRTQAPIDEFAALDLALRGKQASSPRVVRRTIAHLARCVEPIEALFEVDPPDLVLIHQGRGGLHRLIHYLGRRAGCRILHTGEGLLPHTMQWDAEGIDGDAAACRRPALHYRMETADRGFLGAITAGWLGRSTPIGMARAIPRMERPRPPWWRRRASSERHPPPFDASAVPPPAAPFVAVLMQRTDDPRIALDAAPIARATDLVVAADRAATAVIPQAQVVAVLPPGGATARERALLEDHDVLMRTAESAPQTIAAASAVVTVNHPLGIGAVLTRTPLVHCGRTPYGIRGVATHGQLADLAPALETALGTHTEVLRERFATSYLRNDHVWCSTETPDVNGLRGLVLGIERHLGRPRRAAAESYRSGPVWPLHP